MLSLATSIRACAPLAIFVLPVGLPILPNNDPMSGKAHHPHLGISLHAQSPPHTHTLFFIPARDVTARSHAERFVPLLEVGRERI
jgi:hypothetical protein